MNKIELLKALERIKYNLSLYTSEYYYSDLNGNVSHDLETKDYNILKEYITNIPNLKEEL